MTEDPAAGLLGGDQRDQGGTRGVQQIHQAGHFFPTFERFEMNLADGCGVFGTVGANIHAP